MSYKNKPLEIFVLTYNRKQYLKYCLDSILNQSYRDFFITVIDNGSTDGTLELLQEYEAKGVRHIVNEKNIGGIGSIKKACGLATTKWVMIFHDDDVLHSQFMEYARPFFDEERVSVILSYGKKTVNPEQIELKEHTGIRHVELQSDELARLLLKAKIIPFCSAIYNSEFLCKVSFQDDVYGKVGDRPLLLDVAQMGKTILIQENMVLTRIHKFNDSRTTEVGITYIQWISLVKRMRMEALKGKTRRTSISFMIRGRKYLMMPLDGSIIKQIGKRSYVRTALEQEAISRVELIMGIPYHITYELLRRTYRLGVNLKLYGQTQQ